MRLPKTKTTVALLLAIAAAGCRTESNDRNSEPEENVPRSDASVEEVLSLQHDPGTKASHDGQKDAFQRHLAGTKRRTPTHEDSVRARDLASKVKAALAKYSDTALARADGYTPFVAATGGVEVHFNRYDAPGMTLDPAKPSALLYWQDSSGSLKLTGAMYNIASSATPADLEKLTPLSIVFWHRHVNWCIPPLDQQNRWTEKKDGRYVFGMMGYSTKRQCDEVRGLFRTDLAGWMTHVYPFLSDDLHSIWGGSQMGAEMGMHDH